MQADLLRALERLREAGGLSDAELLARFVAARDEAAFACLVRRHGPMVLGVCRRLLRHEQDAEDAFQATFLVLARHAPAVVKKQSLGPWLHAVARRTALEVLERRRRLSRERPLDEMTHPEVAPAEPRDWVPLLDREVSRLPDRYRAAIILCGLQGRSRAEAARSLGIPEGTLSSRLAAARQMLAKRLAKTGLALSSGALLLALARAARAGVSAELVSTTLRQLASPSESLLALTRKVLQTMLASKVRPLVGAVLVAVALGTAGLAYVVSNPSGGAQAAPPEKPPSELDALRKENELLKLNLQVVLEKVRAQEAELKALRGRPGMMGTGGAGAGSPDAGIGGGGSPPPVMGAGPPGAGGSSLPTGTGFLGSGSSLGPPGAGGMPPTATDPLAEAEAALKQLREARDPDTQRKAADGLDKAMKKLRDALRREPSRGL